MDKESLFTQVKEMSKFANKEVGQNYLIDSSVAERITSVLKTNENDNVFEIGAGFGSLSIFLINKKYKTLTFNDIDPRAIEVLDNLVKNQKRAYVVKKSALKIDISVYNKIIGNLPYYITNDLLEYYLARCNASQYVFMIQKEVENRIIAKVNTDDYGPLAVLVSYVGKYQREFIVSKESFLPKPHVDSLVFSITSSSKGDIDKHKYLLFLKKMFIHRRKTIYNNLSLYLMNKDKAKKILDKLKISILTRPEQITPDMYLHIFKLTY